MAGFQTTPWRLISGILGVMSLGLMITLGMLLKFSLTKQSSQQTPSPGSTPEPQEGSGCCPCQEKWIGYQCKCYFISSETKTWAESRNFCASQNSSLLLLKNGDELGFIKSNVAFYWIGLSYNKDHHAWLWEDGSALPQDLTEGAAGRFPHACHLASQGSTLSAAEQRQVFGQVRGSCVVGFRVYEGEGTPRPDHIA